MELLRRRVRRRDERTGRQGSGLGTRDQAVWQARTNNAPGPVWAWTTRIRFWAPTPRKTPANRSPAPASLPPTERRAIEILEAKDHWTKAEIRKAYKKLIKVLHPDMNGGDRSQEEQLQEVRLGLGSDQGKPQLQVSARWAYRRFVICQGLKQLKAGAHPPSSKADFLTIKASARHVDVIRASFALALPMLFPHASPCTSDPHIGHHVRWHMSAQWGARQKDPFRMADGTLDMNAKPTEDISVREVFRHRQRYDR